MPRHVRAAIDSIGGCPAGTGFYVVTGKNGRGKIVIPSAEIAREHYPFLLSYLAGDGFAENFDLSKIFERWAYDNGSFRPRKSHERGASYYDQRLGITEANSRRAWNEVQSSVARSIARRVRSQLQPVLIRPPFNGKVRLGARFVISGDLKGDYVAVAISDYRMRQA